MVFYLSWAANAALFVAACFLAADTANAVFASLLTKEDVAVVAAANPAGPGKIRPRWQDRRVIIERNLFNSATQEATDREEVEIGEDIEETKLPLDLLGTAAADDPAYAWAAVMDRQARKTLVVTIGDVLKEKAEVLRIERRRIILSEDGEPRELTFGDDPSEPPAVARKGRQRPRPRPRPRAKTGASPIRKVAENRFALPREEVEKALSDPADILSQARFLPKYDGEQMLGFQISGMKRGALLQEFGLKNGDLITEFNGTPITSPTETVRMLQEFNEAPSVSIVYQNAKGESKSVDIDLD